MLSECALRTAGEPKCKIGNCLLADGEKEVSVMAMKNTVEVVIAGKVFRISGFESSEYLHQVAVYINEKLAEFQKLESYKKQSADQKQLMLNMNLADDFFKAKRQADKLSTELEKKDREMYGIRHDLIEAQMDKEKLVTEKRELEEQLTLQKKEFDEKLAACKKESAEKLETRKKDAESHEKALENQKKALEAQRQSSQKKLEEQNQAAQKRLSEQKRNYENEIEQLQREIRDLQRKLDQKSYG